MNWKPAERCATVELGDIPDVPGVYVFTDWETGRVEYIGRSARLYNRLRTHILGWASCWARHASGGGSSVWMNWLHDRYAEGTAQQWTDAHGMQEDFALWFTHKYAVVWFETDDPVTLELELIKAMKPTYNVIGNS